MKLSADQQALLDSFDARAVEYKTTKATLEDAVRAKLEAQLDEYRTRMIRAAQAAREAGVPLSRLAKGVGTKNMQTVKAFVNALPLLESEKHDTEAVSESADMTGRFSLTHDGNLRVKLTPDELWQYAIDSKLDIGTRTKDDLPTEAIYAWAVPGEKLRAVTPQTIEGSYDMNPVARWASKGPRHAAPGEAEAVAWYKENGEAV